MHHLKKNNNRLKSRAATRRRRKGTRRNGGKNFPKTMHKKVTKDDIRKVRGIFFVNNVAQKTSKSIITKQN